MPCRIISEMVYSSLIVFSWVFTASWGHLTSAEWWCCHSSSHGNQTGTEGTEGSSRSSEQGEWRQGQQGTGVLPPSHPWNRWLCQQRDLGAPGSSAQWPRTGLGVGVVWEVSLRMLGLSYRIWTFLSDLKRVQENIIFFWIRYCQKKKRWLYDWLS